MFSLCASHWVYSIDLFSSSLIDYTIFISYYWTNASHLKFCVILFIFTIFIWFLFIFIFLLWFSFFNFQVNVLKQFLYLFWNPYYLIPTSGLSCSWNILLSFLIQFVICLLLDIVSKFWLYAWCLYIILSYYFLIKKGIYDIQHDVWLGVYVQLLTDRPFWLTLSQYFTADGWGGSSDSQPC